MDSYELPASTWVIDETALSHPDQPDTAHRSSAFSLQNGRFGRCSPGDY